jgi:hypothetical protein
MPVPQVVRTISVARQERDNPDRAGANFRDLAFDLDPHGMFANPFLDRWLGART